MYAFGYHVRGKKFKGTGARAIGEARVSSDKYHPVWRSFEKILLFASAVYLPRVQLLG
jgi:hypothetical protein